MTKNNHRLTAGQLKTIFSGVQPSGTLHIGNYLGAISNWVDLQDKYNSIFCVVDYHAITVKQDPKELNRNILDVVKIYMASGINPEKSVIFQQSDISAHTELTWILNCITKAGELSRMTQFKDKSGLKLDKSELNKIRKSLIKEELLLPENLKKIIKNIKTSNNKKSEELIKGVAKLSFNVAFNFFNNEYFEKYNKITLGLFDYPVLMASDILLYNTDLVPVGEDQEQHVELSRELARRFNLQFGEVFKVPIAKVEKEGARIMGLDDPTKKMSKSASPANYIALTDSPEVATKKIMKAVTDSGCDIKYDKKNKPAISNLLTIYSLITGEGIKKLESKCECECKGYGDFKKKLAEVVGGFLADFQKRYNSFEDNEIREILKEGADKVRPIAEETLRRVKEKLGIYN